MSFLKILSLILAFVAISPAARAEEDPRTTPGYQLLFDISAEGKPKVVDGYGAYFQYFDEDPANPYFRYCDNFEGKGVDGRPNRTRIRQKQVPFGTVDTSAYTCHDYTLAQCAAGRRLIYIGEKVFFAMRITNWDPVAGGDILFQIARKIPLFGTPSYRTMHLRATRMSTSEWKIDLIIPKGDTIPTGWLHFKVSGSFLGIPNGIDSAIVNPDTPSSRTIDLDTLESARGI